jgi:phosphate-selective porin
MPAYAAKSSALEQLLMKKGILNKSDLDEIKQGVSLEQLLMKKGLISSEELQSVQDNQTQETEAPGLVAHPDPVEVDRKIDQKLAEKFEKEFPVKTEYGDKGFHLETGDGNWATNLQWRAQMRYSNPHNSDPRQVDDFERNDESSFELRRVRMKIGGHGYRPWLKYYFELDLQPTRNADGEPEDAGVRLIDWRITAEKYKWLAFRAGQWKINYNRERVDSSGRQTFVERSIVNRIFTVDRQMGVMAFGRLFPETHADLRYFIGAFNGEGRGVKNDDTEMMYMGRLQWNVFGRDLKFRQSDVSYHREPSASIAFAGATTIGKCTRWSSSGCGNLDGFSKVSEADEGQYRVQQMMQEAALKWRGLAIQQEFHWKRIKDRKNNTTSDLQGSYAQIGYFFHHLIPVFPENLEIAFRYAFVDEPNETNIVFTNNRQEYTGAINYFINGHNNKVTLDFSHLTLEDAFLNKNIADQRVRMQWDVSF